MIFLFSPAFSRPAKSSKSMDGCWRSCILPASYCTGLQKPAARLSALYDMPVVASWQAGHYFAAMAARLSSEMQMWRRAAPPLLCAGNAPLRQYNAAV